jgi:hypothetical protein
LLVGAPLIPVATLVYVGNPVAKSGYELTCNRVCRQNIFRAVVVEKCLYSCLNLLNLRVLLLILDEFV